MKIFILAVILLTGCSITPGIERLTKEEAELNLKINLGIVADYKYFICKRISIEALTLSYPKHEDRVNYDKTCGSNLFTIPLRGNDDQ